MKSPFSGPQRPDPAAPWTSEEVAARLEHVFEMCTAEYHFIPGEDDWTALRKACSLIRSEGSTDNSAVFHTKGY